MGFCLLGGKETYLRKVLSDKLTALGKTIGIGAAPAEFSEDIQEIYDERYAAGQTAATITGGTVYEYVSRATSASMSYTIPANNSYKYVMAICTSADTGAMASHSASMGNMLFSVIEQRTSQSIGGQTVYGSAKIMIGLASIAHSFSWTQDSWSFNHGLKIIYFS